jgi:eukaryotic-like serine/threonine-protein kinase
LLQVGAEVGGFVVESFLGQGAMATVWRVRDGATDEPFALKVIANTSRQPRERLEREAAVQTRIRHPNVVAVYRALPVGEHRALLMELVVGLPLDRLLAREPPDARAAEHLFLQVCAGVEAAHAHGVVHRDLKPANVLVGNLGGLRQAKVSDFGLVRVLGDVASPRLTLGSTPLGTPGYMAPEQVMNAREADERSDIFSLGCILYRMVCGRAPFGGDLREAYNDLSRGVYPPPTELAPGLDSRFARTIEACLRVAPERRPATIADLRELLARRPGASAIPTGGTGREGDSPAPVALSELRGVPLPPPPPGVRSATPAAAPASAAARTAKSVLPWIALAAAATALFVFLVAAALWIVLA